MDLMDYRSRLDTIDDDIVKLFTERMEVAAQIAACKKETGKAVYDPKREREKLLDVVAKTPEDLQDYTASLFSLIMELSRSSQNRLLGVESETTRAITHAIENTSKLFPSHATVACQGVEGAYSQQACDKLFRLPNILYFSSFDAVFSAIENGLCDYGIIPLENSTAGSVNKVYDLMLRHNFRIVRSARIKVDHCLLAKPGTKLSDIKEVYSHEQAISQCTAYLHGLKGVKIIPCANTAMAAKMVAESDRNDIAALSSRACMSVYGLSCLDEAVQDKGNNYTRFICISKNLEIYPGADRTSLMMVVPHQPGSLYKVLSRFYAAGINLNKLESRPMPDRNFEFMFYFDLETSVYSPQFIQLIGELEANSEEFVYLGSYTELV